MRCPKCGYNSFDHLESCKKCGKDLTEHKSRFGIKNILLSSVVMGDEGVVETEEAVDASVSAVAESIQGGQREQSATSPDADDLGFDFMGDSEEEEDLAFDELFEESSPEDDLDETLPGPDEEAEDKVTETDQDDGLDDSAIFDLGEPEDLESEFGPGSSEDMGEPLEDQEEKISEGTELDLDLDDSDLEKLKEESAQEFTEGFSPKIENEEDLQNKDLFEDDSFSALEEPSEELSTASPDEDLQKQGSVQDEPFMAEDDFQEDLFAEDEELPPLPETTLEEQPMESLESSFGGSSFESSPMGASDDFTLGALPVAEVSEEKKNEAPELIVTPDKTTLEESVDSTEPDKSTETAFEEAEEEIDTIIPPSFGRRIGAFFCDIILLGLVGLCFIVVAETALSESSEGIVPSLKTLIDLSIPYFLVVFCLTFGYFTLFHFLAGQTPGKMVTSMRVETSTGGAIAFSQAFIRSVGGLIQIIPVGLGYLSILLYRDGRGWNDRLAGTRLIDLKTLPEEPEVAEES